MNLFKIDVWRAWWPRLVFMASAALLAAGTAQLVPLPLLHSMREYKFFDLHVYRDASRVIAQGHQLYTAHLKHGLGYTYPPFAALSMLPLGWMSVVHTEELVTLANIAFVAVSAHAAVRLHARAENPARAGWVAAAIALWAEPIITTVGYGQIDLLIAALVIGDLAYGRDSRFGGIGIGLAAALKLTPLIFIPYLLFTRRGRMAGRAAVTFALSIVLAFAALTKDAARYWGKSVFDLSRVTGREHYSGAGPANQSLRGALLRFFPDLSHIGAVWLPCCLVVGLLGLLLAVRASGRGNEAYGFLLTAVTGLLISPVSWTHHWAIVVPGALATVTSINDRGTRRLLLAIAIELALVSSALWLVIDKPAGTPLDTGTLLLSNLYVYAGVATLTFAAVAELRLLVAARRPQLPRQRQPAPLRVAPDGLSRS